MMMKWMILLVGSLLACVTFAEAAPRHVYLTWQGDTAHTITVNFQTMEEASESVVYYDSVSHAANPAFFRYSATGRRHKTPGLEDGRTIHWVELTNLIPGQTYYFICGDLRNGFSDVKAFRTIPPDAETFRFVTGGDQGTGQGPRDLNFQASRWSPSFGLVGGDLAYANGELKNVRLWDEWLDNWTQNMITPEGLMIPMVLAIGNHEVKGSMTRDLMNIPFFMDWFAQEPGQTYFSRHFGKNSFFLMLDSGHGAPHGGDQATWLSEQLVANRDSKYKFACYHVPLFPSHRDYTGIQSAMGRQHWMPIFEEFQITCAFENHDHTYKRTKLLRGGQEDPNGILYLGDGCWGRGPRAVDKELRPYLVKQASLMHFWVVDVKPDRVEYRAVSREGKVFDVYPPDAEGAAEAEKVYTILTHPEILF